MHLGQAWWQSAAERRKRPSAERQHRKLHDERKADLAHEEQPMQEVRIGLVGAYRVVTLVH